MKCILIIIFLFLLTSCGDSGNNNTQLSVVSDTIYHEIDCGGWTRNIEIIQYSDGSSTKITTCYHLGIETDCAFQIEC